MAPSNPPKPSSLPADLELALWAERLLALRCVKTFRDDPKQADPSYFVRRMIRWFSETMSTPLAEVERMPLAKVARHYWEAHYEDMTEPGDLEMEADSITQTREEREGKAAGEAKEKAEFMEATRRQAA